MKEVVIIDGQGGRVGMLLVEALKKALPEQALLVIGTNSIATANMLKAGADHGATGENPALVACRQADLILGPIGIILADALLGEVTPAMAQAVGASSAFKLLLPVGKCNHKVIGAKTLPLSELAVQAAAEALLFLQEQK